MNVLLGWDAAVARWVGDRLDIDDFGPHSALAVTDEAGELVAGVVFNNYRYPNIEATLASTDARWCQRKILAVIFAYPFRVLNCPRLTAVTADGNEHARRFLARLGFQEEGVMRRGFRDGSDAVIHGMLRSECRWLR